MEINLELTLNWETEHDTANRIMTHIINDRFKVVSSFKTKRVKIFKDGELISDDDMADMTVNDYTQYIAKIAADAAVISVASAN